MARPDADADAAKVPPPDALRVDIATLRRRGVDHTDVAADLPAPWLADVLGDTDAEVSDAGKVSVQLHIQPGGIVVAQGRLELAFTVPCGRCLDPAAVQEATEIVATYVAAGSERDPAVQRAALAVDEEDGEELGLSEDDLDTWVYEGPHLPLSPVVAEHVRLAYPMRALCTRGEDCRGLCGSCGADLNAVPEATACPQCGNPVVVGGVALPSAGDETSRTPGNPMADALRELRDQLDTPDEGN